MDRMPPDDVVLEVNDLQTVFFTNSGLFRAVDHLSFQVRRGETLAIVGESGCGKSVTALSIMRLVPDPPGRIVGGSHAARRHRPARPERAGDAQDPRQPHRP